MKSYRGSARMSTGFVGADDEKSIEFSVDPQMFQKLDIPKPKPGDEKPYDLEKIYKFQLEKDIIKLKKVKGSYADRKRKYVEDRIDDPFYQAVSEVPDVAKNGNFVEVVEHPTTINAWRLTSQPYGIIAHKRYLEYIANLPRGPTVGEVKDRQQRGTDSDLWEKVLIGKFEKTRDDYRKEDEKKIADEYIADEDPQVRERRKRERARLEALKHNNFEDLRRKMTQKEFNNSMREWNKGWHPDFTTEVSFPVVMRPSKVSGERANDIVQDDKGPKGPREFSGDKFIYGQYGNEKAFADFLADGNYGKAEKHLKHHYRELEKQRAKDEIEEKLKETNRRRIAVTGINVQEDVLRAKFAAAQEALNYNMQIEEASHDEFDAKAKLGLYNSSSFESSGQVGGSSSEVAGDENALLLLKTKEELEVHQTDGVSSAGSSSASQSTGSSSSSSGSGSKSSSGSKSGSGSQPMSSVEEEGEDDAKQGKELMGIHQSYLSPSSKLTAMISKSLPDMSVVTRYLSFARSRTIVPLESLAKYAVGGSNKHKHHHGHHHGHHHHHNNNDAKKDGAKPWWKGEYDTMEEWMEHSKYGKPLHRVHKRLKRIHHWFYDEQPVKTQTDLQKESELQHLVHMTEEINSRDFQDKLLGLTEDYHVKSKEFKEEMKAKYKYFRRLRKKLDHKHATKEEKHRLEVLEIRYGKFMEAFRERKEAEKQAKATIHLMNDMIRHREGEVIAKESTQMELMWKTFLEKYVKQKNPMKGKKKRVDHMLPKVPAHINVQEVDVELFYQEEVREFLKYRIVEREFEQKKKGYVNYIMGIKSKDEEEYELSRTVDELIFAAQSGNYRHVLDLVDYRKKMEFAQNSLVDVNDVGGDGITATFAVVMNVIKHEALDEDANVEDLFLSKWEKRMKKLKWKSKASKLMEMDRIRFDKVIQILLSYGGDLSFPKVEFGKDGMTVFHYAVQTNAMEVVEWLLDHGMDVNHLTTLQHRTALMIAVERNHLELTMFLLKRGAMIAIQHIDNLGNNVLHYAARYASPLLTQLLMLCGVHANVRNKKSMTPAEEAKTFNRMELFTAISSYRSDIKDHVARIECLMAQMLPFDYHTGKFDGFDEDTESAVKPMEDNQEPEQPEGISFVPEETKEENPIVSVRLQRLQQQLDQLNNPKAATSLLPLASSKGRKPMVIPAAATQSTKLSPPVETSPLVISSEQQEGEESSPQDEAVDASTDKKGKDETPSEKRVNKVWNRIQQGFSLKANDSAFDLHPASDPPVAHVHRSKHQTAEEDEEEDDLGPLALPTKHKNDNNIISKPPEHSTMSANLPTIRKKQRGSMIMSAPRIRKTMLQLNFVKNQTK